MEVERQVNDRSLGKERASPCEEGVVGRERSRRVASVKVVYEPERVILA
jgi:hypothetical protein